MVADPSAFADGARVKTWYGPDLERTGESGRSSSASVPVLRRKSRKMQHHVEKRRDARKAGSSGLADPLNRPWCVCSPLFTPHSGDTSAKGGKKMDHTRREAGEVKVGRREGIESGRRERAERREEIVSNRGVRRRRRARVGKKKMRYSTGR